MAATRARRPLHEVAYQLLWSLSETARELGISETTARDNVVRNDEWQAGSNEPYGWLLVLDARIPVYIAAKNGAMKVKAHEARRAIGAA